MPFTASDPLKERLNNDSVYMDRTYLCVLICAMMQ